MIEQLRARLVGVALDWEREFGNAPQVTAAISEFDAAQLLGCSPVDCSMCMRGASAVQRGHDFVWHGVRYQVKATRPSGKPRSRVTKVPQARNYEWDVLVWINYNPRYEI